MCGWAWGVLLRYAGPAATAGTQDGILARPAGLGPLAPNTASSPTITHRPLSTARGPLPSSPVLHPQSQYGCRSIPKRIEPASSHPPTWIADLGLPFPRLRAILALFPEGGNASWL
jgi:hypothetical protein